MATSCTLGAEAVTGAICSSRRASTSVRTRNGVPPVASQQAAANSGSGSTPKATATRVATPLMLRGPTVATSVAGSMDRAANSSRLSPASAGRVPRSTAACNSSRRGSKKARKRSDAPSAQWASSTTNAKGRCSVRLAHNQYSPCSTANDGSGAIGAAVATPSLRPGRPNSRAATPGGPSNSWHRSSSDAPASTGSTSWRTTPNANSRSSSAPRARNTLKPSASAASRATANNTVLPIPAGPSTTSAPPRPCRALCRHSPIRSNSRSRSSKRPSRSPMDEITTHLPYVAPMRVAAGLPRHPRPAITSPRTTTKWKVRGGARGVPPVRIRGPRIEYEPETLKGRLLDAYSELIAVVPPNR